MSAAGGIGRFTILLPITRPPTFLPYAVASVLAQSHADFELFIVSDGAPAATVAWARAAEARDPRVRLFDFSKGERHGEAHRHAALHEASGTCVAHIADDDLWFPDFLAEMALHLRTVDFGNLVQCTIGADGAVYCPPGDLAAPATRQRMLRTRWNLFGPTVAGYRMSAYRQLPVGWSPAPADLFTDLHMWRKFLSNDRLTVGTRFAIQSLAFPTPDRTTWSDERRANKIGAFAERISDPDARRDIAAAGLRAHHVASMAEVVAAASGHLKTLTGERDALKASLDRLQSRQQSAPPIPPRPFWR